MKTLSFAIISGILISLALFWLMQWMISNNQQTLHKTDNIQMTEFIHLSKEPKQETIKKKLAEAPPPIEKRPPPPLQQIKNIQISQVKSPSMSIPTLKIPFKTKGFTGAVINSAPLNTTGPSSPVATSEISSNLIPLVRIPPKYPRRAANRRIEGWVKIEFTINKEGTVEDPVVVDSHPNKIFNSAALRAIRRWKFRAKIVNNKAREQRAIQVLQFKLSK